MPLDAKYQATLTDIMQWSGISPVPDIVLNKHKQDEIDKHPPSWGFRHYATIRTIAAFSPMFVSWGLIFYPVDIVSRFAPLVYLLAFAVILLTGFSRPKGPARWIESFRRGEDIIVDASIPLAIRNVTAEVMSLAPGSLFLVGELRQYRVILDPYLMVIHNDEIVCLGVWDGGTIIHIAQKA